MSTNDETELKKTLEELRDNQTTLLNISKKHLELYAQQISKSDELTSLFLDLQKQSQQYQRTAIVLALVTVFAAAAYVLIISS